LRGTQFQVIETKVKIGRLTFYNPHPWPLIKSTTDTETHCHRNLYPYHILGLTYSLPDLSCNLPTFKHKDRKIKILKIFSQVFNDGYYDPLWLRDLAKDLKHKALGLS